ncbi:hypothetical protein BH18ACI4_BH18ACI4_17230 [soil metagenome]
MKDAFSCWNSEVGTQTENPKPGTRNSELIELRIFGIIFGIVIAALGGVIAYRTLFLEPSSAVIVTDIEVRELPNTARLVGGVALLAIGAIVAFLAARIRR